MLSLYKSYCVSDCVVLFSVATQHSKYVHYQFHFTLFPDAGTKGVARDMKKVCSGAQHDEGIRHGFLNYPIKVCTVMWLFEIAVFLVVYLFLYLFICSNSIMQMIRTKQKQIIKYIFYKYKKEISE